MAIDFPSPATNGQIFSAPNGVVYKWSAAYSSWLAQNPAPPLGGTGDFCALQTSSFPTLTTSYATLILTQIYSGNSGLWYNTANGRYTPPAGRYFIDAGVCITVASSSSPGIVLRKNGTVLIEDQGGGSGASTRATAKVFLIVDANGSDWFDIQGLNSGGAPLFVFNMTFQAFPLTGMQGPTGPLPAGALSLYSETVLATPANAIAVSFPATARLVELVWDVIVTPTADASIQMQGTVGGTPNTTAAYTLTRFIASASSGATTNAGDIVSSTQWAWAGGFSNRGKISFTTPGKGLGVGQFGNISTAGVRGAGQIFLESTLTGLDGYRLICSSNNFAAGSYMRCLVLP